MSTPIKNLSLTVMSQNSLRAEGIETVEQVAELVRYRGMKGLMAINQIGRASANEIVSALCGFLLDHYKQNTPRDYFAAKALQGLACSDTTLWPSGADAADDPPDALFMARTAYLIADAMLEARKEKS